MKSTGYLANSKRFVCVCVLLASAAAQAAGIAFVTNIKGGATADSAKLMLMSELNRGQRIGCAAECTVGIMFLQSGKEFVVKGPGEYLVGENEVTAKIGVPPTMRDTPWRVSSQTVAQTAQTSSASVRMRGVGNMRPEEKLPVERLLYPLQTKVLNLQPVFRWASANAKGPFEFELLASDGGKSLFKAKVAATTIKLPGNIKLLPDAEYNWTVRAAAAALGSGSFKTLPMQSLDLAQKRKPKNKAQFSDWLLYALTLHELGAVQDAQEIWGKLAADRPDLPELAALAK
jgi:hypothetical protein